MSCGWHFWENLTIGIISIDFNFQNTFKSIKIQKPNKFIAINKLMSSIFIPGSTCFIYLRFVGTGVENCLHQVNEIISTPFFIHPDLY